MTTPILKDAFGHHVWATIKLLDVCADLDDARLASVVPGTYGSIIDTVRHLVGADASYLHVLSDGRVAEVEEATLDVAGLRAVMVANGPVWQELVAGDLDGARVITRYREDGSASQAPLGIRIAQVVHHGTDHRSQVCTALTTLGITPPEIDAWDFAWTDDRLVEIPAPASDGAPASA